MNLHKNPHRLIASVSLLRLSHRDVSWKPIRGTTGQNSFPGPKFVFLSDNLGIRISLGFFYPKYVPTLGFMVANVLGTYSMRSLSLKSTSLSEHGGTSTPWAAG